MSSIAVILKITQVVTEDVGLHIISVATLSSPPRVMVRLVLRIFSWLPTGHQLPQKITTRRIWFDLGAPFKNAELANRDLYRN